VNKIPDPPAPAPVVSPDSPEVTLRESAHAVLADLAELDLPGDASRNAQVAERLSEELAEVGLMLRALPGRPSVSGHDAQLLAALRTAHAAGEDIGETVARALARLAAEVGGMWQVLANRPGSWEAALIAELLRGTVGPDDENLPAYGPGAGGSL
jgi:hypothetical protein